MDVIEIRKEFPALLKCPDYVFGDAPTGTQCHFSVSEAMHKYLDNPGAHLMGGYPGAINTQETTIKARNSAAAFFNCKPSEVLYIIVNVNYSGVVYSYRAQSFSSLKTGLPSTRHKCKLLHLVKV